MNEESKDYSVKEAKYAKGMMAIKTPSDTGCKTRAGRLAQSLSNDRYSHRENSYIMSKSKSEKFEKMYKEGWDASGVTGKLREPDNPQ